MAGRFDQGVLQSLVGLARGGQVSAPMDDTGALTGTSGGFNWSRSMQGDTLSPWRITGANDPNLQKLLDAGITYGGGGDTGLGQYAAFNLNPKTGQSALGDILPKSQFGELGQFTNANVNFDASGKPYIDQSNANIRNKGAVTFDPNYGWISPTGNISNKEDWYDKFSGQILPGLIAGGLTAGAGSLIGGGLAGGLFNLPKLIGSNPLQGLMQMFQQNTAKTNPTVAAGMSPLLSQLLTLFRNLG